MRWRFSSGFADGYAPGSASVRPGDNRELYVQYYFKYSSNWTFHEVVNKQVYIWANNADENFYMGILGGGNGDNKYKFKIDLQGTGGSKAKYASGPAIVANRWYKVTGRFVINTGSDANGTAQIWIDDVQVLSLSNLRFWNNADKFGTFAFTPVWGGYQGDKVPSTQYLYLDGLRLQATPFDSDSRSSGQQPSPPAGLMIQ